MLIRFRILAGLRPIRFRIMKFSAKPLLNTNEISKYVNQRECNSFKTKYQYDSPLQVVFGIMNLKFVSEYLYA
ncbi:hypothetical protein BpHYR1_012036 [Brachionus plicatilis]|uniref:Uncharacterized protein n=1 Tax=Brachionus plicatilis TaxID=10195 RepID=A0A3M7QCC4_BRAPC|nr:hypothetical protein BpHYR1_012036 [Brachionus plicatilis]